MNAEDINLLDDILDALECAKEAHSLLPPLPPNMKPMHFRILTAYYRIRDSFGNVRVSDVNKSLGFLLPNTTRFINELVELHILKKFADTSDKRVVLVRSTAEGESYILKYVIPFRKRLEKEFLELNTADCRTMIKTIHKVYQAMEKIYLGS